MRAEPVGGETSLAPQPRSAAIRRLAAAAGAQATRLGWPLVDQAIVSIGTFGLTVALARTLAPHEYGTFALLLGGLMILHMVTASLVFYPLSIRHAPAAAAEESGLLRASLALLAALALPAMAAIAVGLVLAGRADLVLPAWAYFALWQVQEVFRRALFARLRFAAAIPGDIVSYLGQVAAVLALAQAGRLSLATALLAMAATSGLAALRQAAAAGFLRRARAGRPLAAVARDFWDLGRWSLANNVLAIMRVQLLLWGLATFAGAATAAFLQAGLNLVNLMNPLVIGLCNIIPQTAALAHAGGKAAAWRAARPFALAGAPVAVLFFLVLVLVPELLLTLVYGAESPYRDLTLPVRLLAVWALTNYTTDMICSYFHGVEAARLALVVNAMGAAATLAAAVPLVAGFGLTGACLALCLAGIARLAVAQWMLGRLIAQDAAEPGRA
ncbi:MAG: hypothetical protein K2X71_03990 [Methylobacterium sp.]|uniref:hypothetical protein n=1 Tax=Methylobacterium sp. TaxID=409 RepID=UPI002586AAE6|nr:hypothetical protein [Methylobacterium sp.]MBY0295190.1 hypothetical protein [Methylobacterium sp.]